MLRPLLAPALAGEHELVVVRHAGGCQLAAAGSAPPCPCAELPARLRLLRGLPLPLDRAAADDLRLLPGIGPARAAAIVAERARGGPFAEARSLERVPGLGPVTAARLSALVFTGADDPACAAGEGRAP